MIKDIKLPKMLVKEKLDGAILDCLENNLKPLYADSDMSLPQVELTHKLRSHVFYAKSTGNVVVGFENVESFLEKEWHGLNKMGQVSDRVSRMLLVSNDGSERFYRQLKFIHRNHGKRVLMVRLDIDSKVMAEVLGMKGKSVKAALVTHKDSVCNILKQLIADEK